MSPHLIQTVAQAQVDDRLRTAERRRLAAQARARRAAPGAPLSRPRLGLRSLRAAFA